MAADVVRSFDAQQYGTVRVSTWKASVVLLPDEEPVQVQVCYSCFLRTKRQYRTIAYFVPLLIAVLLSLVVWLMLSYTRDYTPEKHDLWGGGFALFFILMGLGFAALLDRQLNQLNDTRLTKGRTDLAVKAAARKELRRRRLVYAHSEDKTLLSDVAPYWWTFQSPEIIPLFFEAIFPWSRPRYRR